MPIIKSAIKRMRQTARKSQRNAITKKLLKESSKKFALLISTEEREQAAKLYPLLQKKIDLAVKKNLMHANKAARLKSRYAKMISDEKEAAPKKSSEKKTVTKKSSAKKASN